MKKIFLGVGVGLASYLSMQCVHASSWVDNTNVSGFMSARYSVTDEAEYFHGDMQTGINEDGSFQGTKLGLTISSRVNDRLSVQALLMSANDGQDYNTNVDWVFGSYRLSEDFTLRFGKIKFPVGLVNEYVDVGATYPWINAPLLLYSDESAGPQATREAYTGASLLWESYLGDSDWSMGTDLFTGEVGLEGMTVKGVLGLTLRANWNDLVELQVSTYEGKMVTDTSGPMAMMNDKDHSARLIGAKMDWNNIVAYAEAAKVEMDVSMMGVKTGDSDAWYATLGYRFGDFLPHITRQEWERDNGNGHQISTLGLSYSVSSAMVLKLEQSRIETDNFATKAGLFDATPSDGSTSMTSIAVDIIF